MSYPNSGRQIVRFADFELDLETRELKKMEGGLVLLPEQPFRILATLIRQAGNLVSRNDLRRELWPEDTFVDFEHGLNAGVKRLRELLGDSATAPRFIQTIPRRGYRFIANVEMVDTRPPVKQPPVSENGKSTTRALSRRRQVYGGGAVLFIALAVYLVSQGFHRERPVEIRAIAVLPLANLSGDPSQEYFADGMTESLINALGQIQALKVVSRTSVMRFKATSQPISEIAGELKVHAVIEGSARRENNRLQILIQLIEATSGKHLWTGDFEREWTDVLSLHNEMAQAIADEIRIQVTPEEQTRLASTTRINPKAHEAYLVGRYHLLKYIPTEFDIAIAYFEHAIEIDPNYAAACAALSHAWWQVGFMGQPTLKDVEVPARAAAQRALELDNRLAEAYVAQGYLKALYDRDWAGAENSLRRALELEGNNSDAHFMYARVLTALGRFPEAIEAIQRAHELDPTAASIQAFYGKVLFWAGRPNDAIVQLKKAIELEPRQPMSYERLGEVYESIGRYDDAISFFEKARDVRSSPNPRLPVFNSLIARVYARTGRHDEALRILDKIDDAAPEAAASAYAVLGDHNRAFRLLSKVVEQRDDKTLFIKTNPGFATLHSDSRWPKILARMNLDTTSILP